MQKITYFWLIAIICFWRAALSVAADPPSLPPLAPDYVRSLKSQNGNIKTTVNFVNRTDNPVDVYWVNYEGGLVFYQHLASGESCVVQTYVTHPWIIYDDRVSSYTVGYLPTATAAQAVIKAPTIQSNGENPGTVVSGNSSSGTDDGKAAVNGSAAAAFDCAKASSPAEKRICSDPLLAKMDHEMGTLYRNLIQNSKNAKAWESYQRAWLVERNRCKSDDGCLRSKYLERLVVLRAAPPPGQWVASWWRVDWMGFYGASVEITKATARSFDFKIQTSAGAHADELEGKATIVSPNKAHWHGSRSDRPKCSLNFERVLNRLEIEASDDTCEGAIGTFFSGTYVASDHNPNTTPDLLSLGVTQTPEQDDALRKLLGKDYDAMAQTANLQSDDEDNLDGNGATVASMFVRGLNCILESILMYDAKGRLWVAVWVPNRDPNSPVTELHYYTNVASDKNKLPKTIAAEQQRCGDEVRVLMMR